MLMAARAPQRCEEIVFLRTVQDRLSDFCKRLHAAASLKPEILKQWPSQVLTIEHPPRSIGRNASSAGVSPILFSKSHSPVLSDGFFTSKR